MDKKRNSTNSERFGITVSLFGTILAISAIVIGFLNLSGSVPLVAATSTNTPTATSTDTPTSTSTDTPTSTSTSTDTPTPTATSTDTPAPPPTPTSSDTPTPTPTTTNTPTPTPTPTPTSDAVVLGFVNLFAGPGTNYETITSLQKGENLDIERTLIGSSDWILVTVMNQESDGELSGWVTTYPDAVKINIDLAEIPPIFEFGPHLLEPKAFEQMAPDDFRTFKWEEHPLAENQYYSILIVWEDLPDSEACFHAQQKIAEIEINPADFGCTPGVYRWGVGIATDLTGGDNLGAAWRDDTVFDERNIIGIGVPPPGQSSNGDNNVKEDGVTAPPAP